MEAGKRPMPVKCTPYRHQQAAFEFACRLFGLTEGGEVADHGEMRDLPAEVPQTPVANAGSQLLFK